MRSVLRPACLLVVVCCALHGAHVDNPPLAITLTCVDDGVIRATVTNVSNRDVAIGVADPYIDYQIRVTDGEGNSVPLTPYGKVYLSKVPVRAARAILITLQPGKSQADTWSLDRFFEFTRPGQYLVTVERRFRLIDETVVSNLLTLDLPR